jgi:alpha-aminoadipic semialdehyde synthase
MTKTLGILREEKNIWERRVPLTPDHVKELMNKHNIRTIIQPSEIRIFNEKKFEDSGAKINEDLSKCSVILAIKEIPIKYFKPEKTYMFFSHTIKGQKYNMPMLKHMMNLGCNLIDYEKITDKNGRRLVFFGKFAGLAGIIDTLWAYGQKMKFEKIKTPFEEIKQTIHYEDLNKAKNHIREVGNKIEQIGLSDEITPFVIGIAGYGNVSIGVQEVLAELPIKEISPKELHDLNNNYSNKKVYKVVFKEEDMVEPISQDKQFDLQEYYKKPNFYQSIFHNYVDKLTILMNCIYWDKQYPRLITKDFVKKNFEKNNKLKAIGDISVDINGAIELTEKSTSPGDPVFVYNPIIGNVKDGYEGNGIVIMAVDNLPCEVPKESSEAFSDSLIPFIPFIIKADFSADFEKLKLPDEIKKAVILHKGKLTPEYQYINKFL